MSAEFEIGERTPERLALAAELIESGRLVNFGGYELHLAPQRQLVVSILTEDESIANVDHVRSDVASQVDTLLASHAVFTRLRETPRLYELIAVWPKGSTWLGFWSERGFERGRLNGREHR